MMSIAENSLMSKELVEVRSYTVMLPAITHAKSRDHVSTWNLISI